MTFVFVLLALLVASVQAADARNDIVDWAKWGVEHKSGFNYAEIRPFRLTTNLPWTGDCSAFVTWCYKQAGAADPNGLSFDGQGYTGTLLSHGTIISKADIQPGDIIVYGPGTGVHTAVIVEPGSDPLTISHGQQGDPSYVRVSQDGRLPQRYVRFNTNKVFAGGPPSGAVAAAPVPAVADAGQSAECTSAGGKCGLDTSCKGTILHGKCPGANNWVCCVEPKAAAPAPPAGPKPAPAPTPASAPKPVSAAPKPAPTTSCSVPGLGSGSCLNTGSGCADGSFHAGYCPGAADIQCCVRGAAAPPPVVPAPKPPANPPPSNGGETKCTVPGAGSGVCQDVATCKGVAVAGFCPGAANIQCCTPSAPPSATSGRWKQIITAIAPGAAAWIVDGLAATMPEIVTKFQINTPNRQAFFLAQTAEESAGFSTTVEFGSGAEYNGRADLGNTQPGDGPRFKGRGIIQLTGRSNYGLYGQILGVDFVDNPDLAAQFPWAALTAGEYWQQRGINSCADANDFVCATERINGGTNGLATREMYLARARQALGGVAVRAGQVTTAAGGGGFPAWAIGVICAVAGVAVLGLLVVLLVRATRKRHAVDSSPLLDSEKKALARRSVLSDEYATLSTSGAIQVMNRTSGRQRTVKGE